MFFEIEGSRKAIGDVDVIYHDGLYHLFHLVLPNHDFIAHAVSTNGLDWRRVNNALFLGDPGSWDDLMLWTVHVTPDPFQTGRWRMFYTGLSRREKGRVQRIGLAVSDDLFHWRKEPVTWKDRRGPNDPEPVLRARRLAEGRHATSHHAPVVDSSCFPLEPDPEYYESSLDEGRSWVSFRDPFYHRESDRGWLLVTARVKDGPVVRRGCVGVLEETEAGRFESRPALHHPGLYDDVEVPNLLSIDGEYYLIGSIREDAKIRYWHTDELGKPWRSYHDNVLMAAGNYAGRVSRDDRGWLLWTFFSFNDRDRTADNVMPPPKRLTRTEQGLLRATSFEGFESRLQEPVESSCVRRLKKTAGRDYCRSDNGRVELRSEAGFQVFVFEEVLASFRLRANLRLRGLGKCGLVFGVDEETHDGYYLSLDLLKSIAQLRAWKTGETGDGENMMQFRSLQSAFWYTETPGEARVQLISFGSYIELSVDGRVRLSLADHTFREGLVGVYLETAHMEMSDVELVRLRSPRQRDDHLVSG